jgi:hypothetical protein
MTTRTERRHAQQRREKQARIDAENARVVEELFRAVESDDPSDWKRVSLIAHWELLRRRLEERKGRGKQFEDFTPFELAAFERIEVARQARRLRDRYTVWLLWKRKKEQFLR